MGTRRRGAAALVAALSTVAALAAPASGEQPTLDGDPATTERISARTPREAAVAISQALYEVDGAAHASLARHDEFADALSGAPLAAQGPMLLVDADGLGAAESAELDRVLPDGGTVYVLGGARAIDPRVEQQLSARGYRVRRLAGPSRVETAVAVADEVRRLYPEGGGVAALARAFAPADNPTAAWADAVTGGAWAADFRIPVLLTATEELHPAARDWFRRDDTQVTTLFGGAAALSEAVEAAVPRPERRAGSERAGTAEAIARRQWGSIGAGSRSFIVLNGYRADGWAFGLPAAGLAVRHRSPLLVVSDDVPAATRELVSECGAPAVDLLLLGDAAVIGEQVEQALDRLDGEACDGPAAVAERVEDEIRTDFSSSTPMTAECDAPPAIQRGAEMPCLLDVHDDGQFEDFALVVFHEAGGTRYVYDVGSGIWRSGQEMRDAYGRGLLCRDLREAEEPYFYAVLYWFAEGQPARMDADGNGVPCETVYSPEEVGSYWSS